MDDYSQDFIALVPEINELAIQIKKMYLNKQKEINNNGGSSSILENDEADEYAPEQIDEKECTLIPTTSKLPEQELKKINSNISKLFCSIQEIKSEQTKIYQELRTLNNLIEDENRAELDMLNEKISHIVTRLEKQISQKINEEKQFIKHEIDQITSENSPDLNLKKLKELCKKVTQLESFA
jgi:hypothetical protein